MSRQIKFRGKTKSHVNPEYMPPRFLDVGETYNVPPMIEGEWVYGFYAEDKIGRPYITNGVFSVDGYEATSLAYEVVPETVGHFTDLLDNGILNLLLKSSDLRENLIEIASRKKQYQHYW